MASYKHLRIAAIFIMALAALFAMTRNASAACTSPDGIAGGITWNGTDSVIWCDGTAWHALKDSVSGTSSGTAGYIQFSNGSGGFSSDSTTGGQLFWDSTNHRLGIGTTSLASPLSIKSAAASSYPVTVTASTGPGRAYIQEKSDSSMMFDLVDGTGSWGVAIQSKGLSWFNGGNVGIGTSSPSYTLSLGGEASQTIGMERAASGTSGSSLTILAGGAKSGGTDLGGGALYLSSGAATGAGTSAIYFQTATPGSTGAADSLPSTKMSLGASGILMLGRGDQTASPSGAIMRGAYGTGTNIAGGSLTFQGGLATGNAATGDIVFSGAPAGSSGTTLQSAATYMTIKGGGATAGNVGIGTTTPSFPLDVRLSGTSTGAVVRVGNATNGGFGYIGISTGTGAPLQVMGAGGDDLALGANNAEVVRITSAGNVGIGTTSPAAKLDVNGFMRLAKNSSAPAVCDATIDGAVALTSARRMCICDATSWKEVNSATACSW